MIEDDPGVLITDPETAVYRHYAWPGFMLLWGVMDGMALAIGPDA